MKHHVPNPQEELLLKRDGEEKDRLEKEEREREKKEKEEWEEIRRKEKEAQEEEKIKCSKRIEELEIKIVKLENGSKENENNYLERLKASDDLINQLKIQIEELMKTSDVDKDRTLRQPSAVEEQQTKRKALRSDWAKKTDRLLRNVREAVFFFFSFFFFFFFYFGIIIIYLFISILSYY
jgi:Fe2+ transport system protein B